MPTFIRVRTTICTLQDSINRNERKPDIYIKVKTNRNLYFSFWCGKNEFINAQLSCTKINILISCLCWLLIMIVILNPFFLTNSIMNYLWEFLTPPISGYNNYCGSTSVQLRSETSTDTLRFCHMEELLYLNLFGSPCR